jgi:hypothetical protein
VAHAVLFQPPVPRLVRHVCLAVAAMIAVVGVAHAGDADRTTDAAAAAVKASEKKRPKLVQDVAKLEARYQKELAGIDKLKRQKASWRRDRQLRHDMAASLETAKKLDKAADALAQLDATLARQRRALIAAIDAELTGKVADARRARLRALRAEVSPAQRRKAKKIVLPDDEIDPLADPDELDQHAKALREGEAELERQIAHLDRQVARFRKQAELRKAHARADELASRDDSRPRRTSGSGGGRTADEAAPQADDDVGGSDAGFEETTVVLADVVDSDTVDALNKAARSTDPSTKATAAQKARDQVKRRLERLEKRRREIEARARKLRD